VLDFQTTGASPARGCLLEAAWAVVTAGGAAVIGEESCLVRLPDGHDIPRRICALTGIRPADLARARDPRQVWRHLQTVARSIARADGAPAPVVIHYARFEEPFLHALHRQYAPASAFPFALYCTHEIARRLYPALPRRSLRALAGFLGHSLPELKRAGPHVSATALVWTELVRELGRAHGVRGLAELDDWLATTPPRRPGRKEYPLPRTRRLALPDTPGVYRLLNIRREVLYVGKAKSLRHRVNSHFQKQRGLPERTLEMLTQVRDVDVTVTATALEAALLEADEIKALASPYNRALTAHKRQVWYFTPELDDMAPPRRPGHTVGPVTQPAVVSVLRRLSLLAPAGLGPAESTADWLLPATEYPPAVDCFNEGWRLFRQKHGLEKVTPADLRRIGEGLWRERAADVSGQETAAEDIDETESTRHGDWTPGRVLRTLEWLVMTARHQLRLGQWLRRLTDCRLIWPRTDEPQCLRCLVFQGGRLVGAEDMAAGVADHALAVASPANPDGVMDLATYDRLRVLSSEMKRLRQEGRAVQLVLPPAQVLTDDALDECLGQI